IRSEFMTRARARAFIAANPDYRAKLNGDLQMHTEWSDGATPISEMANAARELGYRYIGITDHTKGLKIAGGLTEERLEEQGREIDALNAQQKDFTILRSAEMNLSPDGSGDMSAESLEKLDLVLGCFHSALR